MKILISGAGGIVGGTLARALLAAAENLRIAGVDDLIRPGSELNRRELARPGVRIVDAGVRSFTDFATLPAARLVIDAAANPGVLAGVAKPAERQPDWREISCSS